LLENEKKQRKIWWYEKVFYTFAPDLRITLREGGKV
jgi:hypothetical protein